MSRGYRVKYRKTLKDHVYGPDKGPIMCHDRNGDPIESIPIVVHMMTGNEYILGTESEPGVETYGNVKTALLPEFKFFPKPLSHQELMFIDDFDPSNFDPSTYTGIPDETPLPAPKLSEDGINRIDINLLIKPRWEGRQLEYVTEYVTDMINGNKTVMGRVGFLRELFLFSLTQEIDGEKVKKLKISGADPVFLFNIIRDNPNIEELDFETTDWYDIDMNMNLCIPSIKKLTLRGRYITPAYVMNIVRENPQIENLIIIMNMNTEDEDFNMAQLFEILKTNNVLSKLYVEDFNYSSTSMYPKNTYRMADLVDLLHHTHLRHVEIFDSKVVIEGQDVETLAEELKHNQFLNKLGLYRVIPPIETTILESLERIEGNIKEYHDDLLNWEKPLTS